MFAVASCDPAAMVTGPTTRATFGLLLLTVTSVAVAAGFARMATLNTDCPPGAANKRPPDGGGTSTIPTGAASVGGAASSAGLPTTIVNWMMSLPTWNVRVAVPGAPVTMAIVAVFAPCAITIGPETDATAGLLLVTVTG